LLNALALCRGDPLKVPHNVVWHVDDEVRHPRTLPVRSCRIAEEDAKPSRRGVERAGTDRGLSEGAPWSFSDGARSMPGDRLVDWFGSALAGAPVTVSFSSS
jgi:hypothetical protein